MVSTNSIHNNQIGWLQITSGRCPTECQWVVARFTDYITRTCSKEGVRVSVIDRVEGDHPHVYKSTLLSLTGNLAEHCISSHSGTIVWHGQSPYRPKHKRKNWYVGVQPILMPVDSEDGALTSIQDSDLKFETIRATGPGGQNVNRRESAVRVVHTPTGISVVGREERTQLMNRKLAIARIHMQLGEQARSNRALHDKTRWQQHNELERGNPVMKFSGTDFKKVSPE